MHFHRRAADEGTRHPVSLLRTILGLIGRAIASIAGAKESISAIADGNRFVATDREQSPVEDIGRQVGNGAIRERLEFAANASNSAGRNGLKRAHVARHRLAPATASRAALG